MNEILNNPNFEYYRQKFAVLANNNYFRGARDAWVKRLREFGFEAEGFEKFEDFKNYDPTCVIVIGINYFEKPKDRSKIWVAVQQEQFYHPKIGGVYEARLWFKRSLPYLKNYDIILDFSKTNVEVMEKCRQLRKKNIIMHAPAGAGEFSICENPNAEKEYDLLFVGWHSRSKHMPYSRRYGILEPLLKKYNVYPLSNSLWGEKKQEAIRKSKICLNLHPEETRVMESSRFLDYFANHAFVMSDRIYDPAPFADGEDFVSFFLTDIEDKIDYYLSHEEERNRIADNAFEKVKKISFGKDAVALTLDAVLLEAEKRNYPKVMKQFNYRRRRQWIYDHLPKNIRDRIM